MYMALLIQWMEKVYFLSCHTVIQNACRYLEQYHTARYSYLLLSGKLWTYLADLNEQARKRMECMITQMKAAEDVTEELKARDLMAWVGAMNRIRSRAEEIILREMIYEDEKA